MALDLQPRAPEYGARRHHANAEVDDGSIVPLLLTVKSGGITVSFNRATEKDEAAALLELAFQKVISDSVDIVRAYARHAGEWENLKKEHWFAFAHHLRNAFSHNGSWHFERHAVVPVQWRRYSIDRSMQGESASAFLSHYDGTELMAQMILYVSGFVDYRQIHIPRQPSADAEA